MGRALRFLKWATQSERRTNKPRQNTFGFPPYHRRLLCEPLEDRRLLSVFTVTALSDRTVTKAGDLPGSLRQAIFDANSATGADTIKFASGLSGTITLTAGELAITGSVTIDGPGAANLTIDAGGNSRIFDCDDGNLSNSVDVTIDGLTLTGGNASGTSPNNSGGAIYSVENLTVSNSVITKNTATGDGGGIGLPSITSGAGSGTLTIQNSVISGNTAGNAGGGIYSNRPTSAAIVQNSTISGNTAASGGGISLGETMTIQNSIISENTASSRGGGIDASDAQGGASIIQDSTISGNTASDGGGIAAAPFEGGTLTIENSTISGNSASGDGAGIWAPALRNNINLNQYAT